MVVLGFTTMTLCMPVLLHSHHNRTGTITMVKGKSDNLHPLKFFGNGAKVSLTDMLGTLIFSEVIHDNHAILKLQPIPDGVYLIQLMTEQDTYTKLLLFNQNNTHETNRCFFNKSVCSSTIANLNESRTI